MITCSLEVVVGGAGWDWGPWGPRLQGLFWASKEARDEATYCLLEVYWALCREPARFHLPGALPWSLRLGWEAKRGSLQINF